MSSDSKPELDFLIIELSGSEYFFLEETGNLRVARLYAINRFVGGCVVLIEFSIILLFILPLKKRA
jgi:hypothetical protein